MKPHPRIRKTVKWGGAAATPLLLAGFLASGFWEFAFVDHSSGWCAAVTGGEIIVEHQQRIPGLSMPKARYVIRHSFWIDWLPRYPASAASTTLALPLWPAVLAGAGVTALAWRLDTLARRRADLTHCPRCRYDRSGLAVGAVCPECGAAAPQHAAAR